MTHIITYTGKKFSLFDPQPEDICIEDIAHHLSLICRYNGACKHHYSVAQHCVLAKELVPGHAAQALFHDAGEAYYGDIPTPFKTLLQQIIGDKFIEILKRIDKAIFDKFEIPWPCDPEIKQIDNQLFVAEWFHLMSDRTYNGVSDRIIPWPAVTAEDAFLNAAHEVC